MWYNIRPIQKKAPAWPWKNLVRNGLPAVVSREACPTMPDLITPFNWKKLEEIPVEPEIPLLPDLMISRDMKSVFTTAVRMYDYVGVHLELESGNDPFEPISKEMRRWMKKLLSTRIPLDAIVIGDDLAHAMGPFIRPSLMGPYWDQLDRWRRLAHANDLKLIFHTDGRIWKIYPELRDRVDWLIIQLDLNPELGRERWISDHTAVSLSWESYRTREM